MDNTHFVITGTGRCGTQYVAAVLNTVGIPTGHETVYGPEGPVEWPEGLKGDVSWLALPHLKDFDGPVIHLTRDQESVVASMRRIGFLSGSETDAHERYASVARSFLARDDLDPEFFVTAWRASIEGLGPVLTIDVSELDDVENWDRIWEAIGVEPPSPIRLAEAIHTYRYVNTRGHAPWRNMTVGFVHNGDVTIEFNNFLYRCGRRHINVIAERGGARVASARNQVVTRFLAETDHEWLLMLDTDHHVPWHSVETLFSVADEEHPIVGGITFSRDRLGKLQPTVYRVSPLQDEHGNRVHRWTVGAELPDNTLIEVDATGAACILMHRTVLEKMRDTYPKPYVWFQDTQLEDEEVGEDVTFCFRARNLDYPVYVHTGAEFPHLKVDGLTWNRWIRERLLERVAEVDLERVLAELEDG